MRIMDGIKDIADGLAAEFDRLFPKQRKTQRTNLSKLSDRYQVLMLAVHHGEHAVPLLWRVEATEGAIGFSVQKDWLDAAAPWSRKAPTSVSWRIASLARRT